MAAEEDRRQNGRGPFVREHCPRMGGTEAPALRELVDHRRFVTRFGEEPEEEPLVFGANGPTRRAPAVRMFDIEHAALTAVVSCHVRPTDVRRDRGRARPGPLSTTVQCSSRWPASRPT
jgi:hypothetical protein